MLREITTFATWLGAGWGSGFCAECVATDTVSFPFLSVSLAVFTVAGFLHLRRTRLRSFLAVMNDYADRQLQQEITTTALAQPAVPSHE